MERARSQDRIAMKGRFHDAIRPERKRREVGLKGEKGVDRILKPELLQPRGECFAWQLSIRVGGARVPSASPLISHRSDSGEARHIATPGVRTPPGRAPSDPTGVPSP